MELIVAFGLLSWLGAAGVLDRYGRQSPERGDWDAIVVAGCKVRPDGSPSLALQRRTALAVQLWQEQYAPLIVFTGGVGNFPPSEAAAAAGHAMSLGVPQAAILLEDRSTSTEENAAFAATLGPRKVLLVTDAYHVFRAERTFERHFDEVRGVGSVGAANVRFMGSMREVLAIGWYAASGRI